MLLRSRVTVNTKLQKALNPKEGEIMKLEDKHLRCYFTLKRSEAGCWLTLYNGGNDDTIYDQKAQKEAGLPTYLNATVTNTNSNGNCCELELELEHQLERELVRTPTRTRTGMAASGGQITYVMRKKWRKSFGYWTRGGKMDFRGFSTYERDNIDFLNKTDVK